MQRLFVLIPVAACVALTATGPARAAQQRYYNYEPDSFAARYRTQDVTLAIQPGLLSSRVVRLYRKRAAPFTLHAAGPGFDAAELKPVLPEDAASGSLSVYAVDDKEGAPFARGSCKGAERAWIAMTPPRAYRDLTIYVLTRDPGTRGPRLCETLAYRWRAEWLLPEHSSIDPESRDGPATPR